jgi:hypothetical protein
MQMQLYLGEGGGQVTFQWDDDYDVRFVLHQHALFEF